MLAATRSQLTRKSLSKTGVRIGRITSSMICSLILLSSSGVACWYRGNRVKSRRIRLSAISTRHGRRRSRPMMSRLKTVEMLTIWRSTNASVRRSLAFMVPTSDAGGWLISSTKALKSSAGQLGLIEKLSKSQRSKKARNLGANRSAIPLNITLCRVSGTAS